MPLPVAGVAVKVTVRPLAVALRPVVVVVATTVALWTEETDPAYEVGALGTNVAV